MKINKSGALMRTILTKSCAKAFAIRFIDIQLHSRQTIPSAPRTNPPLAHENKFINRLVGVDA